MAGRLRFLAGKASLWKSFSTADSRRHFFSAAYTQPECLSKYTEQRKRETASQSLPSVCLHIDRCAERGLPYSSLTIDDMVHTMVDRDDVVSSMYYLHKFRHSDTGYFLRPWTTYFWIRKCIELGATDLALKALDERSQYGIFPDSFTLSLLIHDAWEANNHDLSFKFASYVFLTESFDSRACQISCLFVILNLVKSHGSLSPDFSSIFELRNFSGLCIHLGRLLSIKSLTVLGYAGLGILEKEHGIRSVYQDPWGPLMWTDGYMEKAIAEIGVHNISIHRDVLNRISALTSDNDALSSNLKENILSLESAGRVCEEPLQDTLLAQFSSQMPEVESSAIEFFTNEVKSWMTERQQLVSAAKQMAQEQALERKEHFEALNLRKHARKMAVERLGYWEFLTEDIDMDDVELHLRNDYVVGSLSDIDIERRIDSINSK